jgi:hypothetical protein
MDFEKVYMVFSATIVFLFVVYYAFLFGDSKKRVSREERVMDNVDRMKRKALEKDVPEVLAQLFLDKVRYYPELMQGEKNFIEFMKASTKAGTSIVPAAVKKAVRKSRSETFEVIELQVNEEIYEFTFKHYLDDVKNPKGLLEISLDGKRVFALEFEKTEDDTWYQDGANSIKAFIDGPWVEELKGLLVGIKESESNKKKERKKKAATKEMSKKNKKLKDLQDSFGV